MYSIQDKIDSGQLRSAKDLENFISAVQTSGSDPIQEKLLDQNMLNLTRVQKSSSLDSKLIGQRRNNLKVNITSKEVHWKNSTDSNKCNNDTYYR